jgi:thymidylate synthase (FAD)
MKVTYIDHMGTDLSVVNAAKVSFGKLSEWENDQDDDSWVNPFIGNYRREMRHPDFVGKLSKQDQGLIQFLARGCTSGDWESVKSSLCDLDGTYDWECFNMEEILNHVRRMPSHWSPFAHTAISLHLKMPIFVARQIMKHTTGIEYNEVSRRYVDSEPEFYFPDVWRKKADNVKQGSSDEAVKTMWVGDYGESYEDEVGYTYSAYISQASMLYDSMIKAGIAPEQARMVLPQSMYTEVIATGNLYAWANMYIQCSGLYGAQKEAEVLAKQIGEIVKPLYPVSWDALTK